MMFWLLLSMLLVTTVVVVDGFLLPVTEKNYHRRHHHDNSQRCKQNTLYGNWLGDLWDEVIEFSTYGPGERRMLKAKREADAAANAADDNNNNNILLSSFQQAKRQIESKSINKAAAITSSSSSSTNDTATATAITTVRNADDDESIPSLSLKAFQTAVASRAEGNTDDLEFGGYAMRDLLLAKWGIPLDIDFQRGYSASTVYCTVLPVVGFGTFKARHASERDYLMHLQAVVEILHQYNNLDAFIMFIQSTQRVPKPGVESVPFRLDLNEQDRQKILGTTLS